MSRADVLCTRLAEVKRRMVAACERAGRAPESVRLVAISKFHPASDIAALAACGQRDFGESYVQEALAKQDALVGEDILWHFVGGLQTKKAKNVVDRFCLAHSVDSEKLARELARRAIDARILLPVLIEVNLGEEEQKAGVDEADLNELAEVVVSLNKRGCGLDLRGLMCLPPMFDAPEEARPYFAHLRELRDELSAHLGIPLPELSMGMTGDFEAAIEEGATLIRVGTSIFGSRPPKG
ncbi:MAG: YggS family pyridoxal phosphate-dependent enzyme [Humidesulfovibrio sp.]|uniref:YggS family pyridoxal phosphate-dependent enzyme n=1 Tax=Humidesulfovibrio sp. TaxID=2910988 RepID=UPI0027341F94|nr:YggS family pyridoxal phosphate-dependent enzyme [Humidesulfovibrio sp.]MDP2846921.1 YggS family pyridoxal phosphate-dependent enzyme [Humidesulfovibrio sp.]